MPSALWVLFERARSWFNSQNIEKKPKITSVLHPHCEVNPPSKNPTGRRRGEGECPTSHIDCRLFLCHPAMATSHLHHPACGHRRVLGRISPSPPCSRMGMRKATMAREGAHIAVEIRRWSHHKHTSNMPTQAPSWALRNTHPRPNLETRHENRA